MTVKLSIEPHPWPARYTVRVNWGSGWFSALLAIPCYRLSIRLQLHRESPRASML